MLFDVMFLHGYFQYQMWTCNLWTRSMNGFTEVRVILGSGLKMIGVRSQRVDLLEQYYTHT